MASDAPTSQEPSLTFFTVTWSRATSRPTANLANLSPFSRQKAHRMSWEPRLITALQTLSVRRGQLEALPDSIGLLVAVKTSSVSNNKLTMLPEFIGDLAALEYLHLAKNVLTTLPASTGRLVALRTVDIEYNMLTRANVNILLTMLPELVVLW